jgi:hypothetical protein
MNYNPAFGTTRSRLGDVADDGEIHFVLYLIVISLF